MYNIINIIVGGVTRIMVNLGDYVSSLGMDGVRLYVLSLSHEC